MGFLRARVVGQSALSPLILRQGERTCPELQADKDASGIANTERVCFPRGESDLRPLARCLLSYRNLSRGDTTNWSLSGREPSREPDVGLGSG